MPSPASMVSARVDGWAGAASARPAACSSWVPTLRWKPDTLPCPPWPWPWLYPPLPPPPPPTPRTPATRVAAGGGAVMRPRPPVACARRAGGAMPASETASGGGARHTSMPCCAAASSHMPTCKPAVVADTPGMPLPVFGGEPSAATTSPVACSSGSMSTPWAPSSWRVSSGSSCASRPGSRSRSLGRSQGPVAPLPEWLDAGGGCPINEIVSPDPCAVCTVVP
jgi:hypothetical protein